VELKFNLLDNKWLDTLYNLFTITVSEYDIDYIIIIIIIIGIQPLGRSGQTTVQSGYCYGSGTLHPGQVLRRSLPLLSPVTIYIFFYWHNNPQRARASSFTRFLDHTQRRATVGRTPLDE